MATTVSPSARARKVTRASTPLPLTASSTGMQAMA